MDVSKAVAVAGRGRWAVAAMFFANGFVTGSWAPQIPVFLTRLQMRETTLGLLILAFGFGALTAMPLCGYLVGQHGSRRVLRIIAPLLTLGLPAVALAPNVAVAAFAMYLFGGVLGGMDVTMNANAVAVERKLTRAIMSSSHGFWSLGAFAGGGLGGLVIQNFGHLAHAVLVSVAAGIIVALALGHLVSENQLAADVTRKFSLPKNPLIYLIGTIALFSMVPEGAVLDWAALYLRQERGADLATAGFAFAGFSAMMACMRFAGDGVRNRFGAVRTLRISSLIGATGILAAGLSPSPWLAVAAFTFAGLGVANMVPIAFSAAGNQKGMSPSSGMSVVTVMGYSGILAAPSIIGFIAERTGLGPIFVGVSGLLLIVCFMAGLVQSAEFGSETQ